MIFLLSGDVSCLSEVTGWFYQLLMSNAGIDTTNVGIPTTVMQSRDGGGIGVYFPSRTSRANACTYFGMDERCSESTFDFAFGARIYDTPEHRGWYTSSGKG